MQKFKKWIANYWYHYKWVTVIVLFFAIVLGIGIFQIASKESYDIDILYTGPAILSASEKQDLASAFASVMPDDFNDDSEKTVLINDITILSDEQIAEKEAEAAADNDRLYYDYNNRQNAISQVSTLLATGETTICLMDDFMYRQYKDQGAFLPLSDVLDSLPDYARDDYSVYLKDTPFGAYFTACRALPEDTVLCIRKESVMNGGLSKKAAGEQYELCKKTFRKLFTFSVAG